MLSIRSFINDMPSASTSNLDKDNLDVHSLVTSVSVNIQHQDIDHVQLVPSHHRGCNYLTFHFHSSPL